MQLTGLKKVSKYYSDTQDARGEHHRNYGALANNSVNTLLVRALCLILRRFLCRLSKQVTSELHAHADIVHERFDEILFGAFEYVHNISFPIRWVVLSCVDLVSAICLLNAVNAKKVDRPVK